GSPAGGADRRHHLGARTGVAAVAGERDADVVDDDRRPVSRERERLLAPESAPGAGHDRHLPVEESHACSLLHGNDTGQGAGALKGVEALARGSQCWLSKGEKSGCLTPGGTLNTEDRTFRVVAAPQVGGSASELEEEDVMRLGWSLLVMSLVVAGNLVAASDAKAAVLCQKKNGQVFSRAACKSKETTIDVASLGLVGPTGPTGAAGTNGA